MGLAVAIPGLIVNGILFRRQKDIELELAQIKDMLCTDWEPATLITQDPNHALS